MEDDCLFIGFIGGLIGGIILGIIMIICQEKTLFLKKQTGKMTVEYKDETYILKKAVFKLEEAK